MTPDSIAKSRRMPSTRPEAFRRFPPCIPHPTLSPETHLVQLEPARLSWPIPTHQSANSFVVLLSVPGFLEKSYFEPPQLNDLHPEPPPPQLKALDARRVVDSPHSHREISNGRVVARRRRLSHFVFLCLLSLRF